MEGKKHVGGRLSPGGDGGHESPPHTHLFFFTPPTGPRSWVRFAFVCLESSQILTWPFLEMHFFGGGLFACFFIAYFGFQVGR